MTQLVPCPIGEKMWAFKRGSDLYRLPLSTFCVVAPPNLTNQFILLPLQKTPSPDTVPSILFCPPYGKEVPVTGFPKPILDATVISRLSKEEFAKWIVFGLCNKSGEDSLLHVGVKEITPPDVTDAWKCQLKTDRMALSSILIDLHIEGLDVKPSFRVGAEPPTIDTLLHVCADMDKKLELEVIPIIRLLDTGIIEERFILVAVVSPFLERMAISGKEPSTS